MTNSMAESILEMSYKPLKIPLKSVFTIATGSSSYYEGVLVKIKTKEFEGLGEASPSKMVGGENVDTVVAVLKLFKNKLIGRDITEIESIMENLDSVILGNYSAKAAVDIAIHDLLGKISGLSVKKLLGGHGNGMDTSITIGIKSIENTVNDALTYKKQGFKILKIKVGTNSSEDILKIQKVRDSVGQNIKIRVDANQGYTVKDAIWFSKQIEPLNIELIEQPVKYWDFEGLKKVKDRSNIPIMADEALKDSHDLLRLIKMNAMDMINIKIMKVGGIRKAMELASIAKAECIPIMVGCMSETKIGIAAGMHFSLSKSNIKIVDLDSHLNHKKEVVNRGVITKDGVNQIYNEPGLGVSLKKGVKL